MLFTGGKIAKEGKIIKKLETTNIWKNHPELHSEFGTYPTIFLDLKDTKPCDNYD